VDGLVNNPLSLSYEALLGYPTVTDVVLLICRSTFADNAQWTGVPVVRILTAAGVKPQASQVTFHGLDGYEQTLQLKEILGDGVFLAHAVDAQTLPKEHGYPLRLVVTGKYGFNWVKWVDRIEVK
jgi:DMSO/TMAO reductase YedYZ molybdopterin-dependent catalytic subunit